MSIHNKIQVFLKNNYGSQGIKYFNKKLKLESITSLDDVPRYEQERFVNAILDDLFKSIFTKEKLRDFRLLIFSQIFGKSSAIKYVFNKEYIKGTPPIKFIESFFGEMLGESLITVLEHKFNSTNIKKKDDPEQILFVNQCINEIFKDRPDLSRKINLKFAKYLKKGFSDGFTSFQQMVDDSDEVADDLLEKAVEYLDLDKDENWEPKLKKILDKMSISPKKKEKFFENFKKRKEKGIRSIDKGRAVEAEIIENFKAYISRKTAKELIREAKINSGIIDLHVAPTAQKKIFFNYLIKNSKIANFSPQKASVFKSWLIEVLKI